MSAEARTSATLRFGLIGAGRQGTLHARNILARRPRMELVGIADPNRAAVDPLAAECGAIAFADWRQLVSRSDIDAVVICSPPEAHPEQIASAAAAGKHVFCEKPIGRDLDAVDHALVVVERAGVVLQIGFNRRFDKTFRALRQAVAENKVGKPCLLKITQRDTEPPPVGYVITSGGLFVDMTIHDFDLARYLLAEDVIEVGATGSALLGAGIGEVGDVDTAIVTLRFASGALGVIDNSRQARYGYDQRAEVHGTDGMACAENVADGRLALADASGFYTGPLPSSDEARFGTAFALELEAFANAVEGGPIVASGHDGRHALAIALAANRSLAERRFVTLGEVEAH